MELTITISEEEMSKVCKDRIVRLISEHVGSYEYNSIIKDKVLKALRNKADDIIASRLSDVDEIKEMVCEEIERRIRLNITREITKKEKA